MTALDLLNWMASEQAYELVRWPFQEAANYRVKALHASLSLRLLHRHGTLTPEQRRHLHRCLREHVAKWHGRAAHYAATFPTATVPGWQPATHLPSAKSAQSADPNPHFPCPTTP